MKNLRNLVNVVTSNLSLWLDNQFNELVEKLNKGSRFALVPTDEIYRISKKLFDMANCDPKVLDDIYQFWYGRFTSDNRFKIAIPYGEEKLSERDFMSLSVSNDGKLLADFYLPVVWNSSGIIIKMEFELFDHIFHCVTMSKEYSKSMVAHINLTDNPYFICIKEFSQLSYDSLCKYVINCFNDKSYDARISKNQNPKNGKSSIILTILPHNHVRYHAESMLCDKIGGYLKWFDVSNFSSIAGTDAPIIITSDDAGNRIECMFNSFIASCKSNLPIEDLVYFFNWYWKKMIYDFREHFVYVPLEVTAAEECLKTTKFNVVRQARVYWNVGGVMDLARGEKCFRNYINKRLVFEKLFGEGYCTRHIGEKEAFKIDPKYVDAIKRVMLPNLACEDNFDNFMINYLSDDAIEICIDTDTFTGEKVYVASITVTQKLLDEYASYESQNPIVIYVMTK